jgi:four helix bundle protein
MRDFRKLKVWEKAHRLTMAVYVATREFPQEERYGMTAQMRRSGSSIPCNIAEGCGRNGVREFARFLEIAAGSASELEYQLLLARELHFLTQTMYDRLAADTCEVKQMLTSLIQTLHSPSTPKTIDS